MDPNALNYDSIAICDDGTCCFVSGCNDATACNYDPNVCWNDGSCDYPNGCGDTMMLHLEYDASVTCSDASSCLILIVNGCTDASACNYNAAANVDDGSCEFLTCAGCTDPTIFRV